MSNKIIQVTKKFTFGGMGISIEIKRTNKKVKKYTFTSLRNWKVLRLTGCAHWVTDTRNNKKGEYVSRTVKL